MKTLEEEAIKILKEEGKWSHLFIFGNPSKPYPTNFEHDLNKVIVGLTSKYVQAEKIKAQIEVLKLAHLRLSVEGIDKADVTMVFTINELEQQLKQLEDESRTGR